MDELETLAALLDKLPVDPQARMGYDCLAGALVWGDEAPAWDWSGLPEGEFPIGHGELRALWNHRSTLICGEPSQRFAALWERAAKLCPNWPGFVPARRDPALAEEYRRRAEASASSFEELEARFEKQLKDRNDRAIA